MKYLRKQSHIFEFLKFNRE